MDIFDMFDEPEVVETKTDKEVSLEIMELSKKHNIKMTRAFADELADIFRSPPPWAPWAK